MKRLLIDTDPGVDDALAIMMASAYPDTEIPLIGWMFENRVAINFHDIMIH